MKKLIIKNFMFVLFVTVLSFSSAIFDVKINAFAKSESNNIEISSRAGILVEYNSGEILFEKNADEKLPVASMTKLASLAVVFEALSKGIIKDTDEIVVSETAANVGGSSAFLDAGSKYKLVDLIKTIIVSSANDSTVAVAEYIAGTEEMFVLKMNKFASNLGLKNTHFINSTGLPVDGHYSSARDMAQIYKAVCQNKLYKKYAKIWMEDFIHPSGRKTGLVNTNRLVKTFDGIEGGKTGYTDAAKFCLTASASRSGTRFIGVIIGANDSKTRFAEMSKLFSYGFANFETKLIVNSELPVSVAKFKGAKKDVPVYAARDSFKFLKKGEDSKFDVGYEIYEQKAPISSGSNIGKLFVFDKDNMVVDEIDLIVKENVDTIGFKETFDKIVNIW